MLAVSSRVTRLWDEQGVSRDAQKTLGLLITAIEAEDQRRAGLVSDDSTPDTYDMHLRHSGGMLFPVPPEQDCDLVVTQVPWKMRTLLVLLALSRLKTLPKRIRWNVLSDHEEMEARCD